MNKAISRLLGLGRLLILPSVSETCHWLGGTKVCVSNTGTAESD